MILLDHCVPRRYLHLLHGWGYAAEPIGAHIALDSPDADVIALANQLDAVLLTTDLDFANILDYPPQQYGGIVILRYRLEHEAELDAALKAALDDLYRDRLRGALVIVAPGRYRIRS
jgi:predicted nuclease of predicted toxin-antitoxin system